MFPRVAFNRSRFKGSLTRTCNPFPFFFPVAPPFSLGKSLLLECLSLPRAAASPNENLPIPPGPYTFSRSALKEASLSSGSPNFFDRQEGGSPPLRTIQVLFCELDVRKQPHRISSPPPFRRRFLASPPTPFLRGGRFGPFSAFKALSAFVKSHASRRPCFPPLLFLLRAFSFPGTETGAPLGRASSFSSSGHPLPIKIRGIPK